MFERKFGLIEGESFQLHELGKEIESIVGSKLENISGEAERIIGFKTNAEDNVEFFNIRFQLLEDPDYVDVVGVTDKKPQLSDYDFEKATFKVNLVSYHRMSRPKDNFNEKVEK